LNPKTQQVILSIKRLRS